jgi:hypothetical protein
MPCPRSTIWPRYHVVGFKLGRPDDAVRAKAGEKGFRLSGRTNRRTSAGASRGSTRRMPLIYAVATPKSRQRIVLARAPIAAKLRHRPLIYCWSDAFRLSAAARASSSVS